MFHYHFLLSNGNARVYFDHYCVSQFVQSARNAATQKRNIELDELERELGLDILDDMGHVPSSASTTSDGAGSNPGQVHNKEPFIESALPNRDAGHGRHGSSSGNMSGGGAGRSGCVPTHWITGIFTGSLPPDQSALLLDWAIVNNSPFAGAYFVCIGGLCTNSVTLLPPRGCLSSMSGRNSVVLPQAIALSNWQLLCYSKIIILFYISPIYCLTGYLPCCTTIRSVLHRRSARSLLPVPP